MLITSELHLMDDSYLNNTTPQKPYKRILRQHHPIPADLPHKSPAVPPVVIEAMRPDTQAYHRISVSPNSPDFHQYTGTIHSPLRWSRVDSSIMSLFTLHLGHIIRKVALNKVLIQAFTSAYRGNRRHMTCYNTTFRSSSYS